MKTLEAKVVLLGDQGVGKTSILIRYMSKKFPDKITSTIGASFFNSKIIIEDYKVKLQVWDTAGHERFKAMAPMFYRNSNAAIVVFDITQKQTFEEVRQWVSELTQKIEDTIVISVVGNKVDLASTREVPFEEAERFARSVGAKYTETSAYTNEGIDDVFFNLGLDLIKVSQAKAIRALQQPTVFSDSDSLTRDQNQPFRLQEKKIDDDEDKKPIYCC